MFYLEQDLLAYLLLKTVFFFYIYISQWDFFFHFSPSFMLRLFKDDMTFISGKFMLSLFISLPGIPVCWMLNAPDLFLSIIYLFIFLSSSSLFFITHLERYLLWFECEISCRSSCGDLQMVALFWEAMEPSEGGPSLQEVGHGEVGPCGYYLQPLPVTVCFPSSSV